MSSKRYVLPAAALLLVLLAPAGAQTQIRTSAYAPGMREGYTRVTANYTIFVPGPTGEGEEADKVRERARRTVYTLASRECDVLRETLAQECILETVNHTVNVSPRYAPNTPEGYNVNGALTLSVKLKKD